MKKILTISLLLGGIILYSQGQDYKKYRQKKISVKSLDRIDPVESKLQYADELFEEDAESALKLVEEALLISIKEGNIEGEAQCYHQLGDINFDIGEYRLSYSNYKKAKDIYTTLNHDYSIYSLLIPLGRSSQELGLLDEALTHFEQYKKMAVNKKDKEDALEAESYIAGIYKLKGDLTKSEEQYQKVYEQGNTLQDKRVVLNSTKNLGEIKAAQNNQAEAINYYQQSLQIANELKDEKEVNDVYEKVSQVHKQNKDLNKALEIKQEAVEYNYKNNNPSEWARNNIDVANLYIEQDNSTRAIEELEKTVQSTEKTGDLENKKQAMEALSRAYEKEGDKEKALQSFKEYLRLEDSLNALRANQLIARAEQKQLLENVQNKMLVLEKDKELDAKTIELLKKERRLKEEQIQRQQTISYSLGVIILILMITGYLIAKNVRQKRIANQLLMLKSLRSQMNPHFIFNALNSVNNFISKSDERSANKYLSDFSKLMRQVMENSQLDFIPLATEIEILELYLKLEHFRFKDKFDYQFEVDPEISVEDFTIPPMLIQPYIENAVWHGLRYKEKKGFLSVHIGLETNNLKITIEDDGIGRKKSQEVKTKNQKASKSTGIKNIDSRLNILNDVYNTQIKVDIQDLNEDGSGTKVTFVIRSIEAEKQNLELA